MVNKHEAYLPVTSLQEGNCVWKSVAEDYNSISKGLFSYKDPNQLNGKWRNILYHARKFGYPHPLESKTASQQQESDLARRVQELISNPENVESKPILDRDSRSEGLYMKSPKPDIIINSRKPHANIATKPQKSTMISKATSANYKTRKEISMVALEFEQEKLRQLKEKHKLEKSKLLVELETAKVQLQREKLRLLVCKNEAQVKGIET